MSQPTDRNRLGDAASPYLRQHADNPVNWQPWDEQALAAAREHDVPIFLSIGYSACHWCHVMEEESFEDEGVASILNQHFVPIKVDREERPDLDSVYMSICQRVTGRGGWPLSAWLTPEGDPFYVGTYFPPEAKRGQPSFRQLLQDVHESWSDPEERESIEDRAEQWTAAVRDDLESVPDQPSVGDAGAGASGEGADSDDGSGSGSGADVVDADQLERAAEAALRGADREHGGWGSGPKFPHPGRIHQLLQAAERTGRGPFRDVALETLDAMANGGMYDHVGGGFHRYATDRDWTVPHFEKMLYDNAELPRAYLAGYQVTGDERYRTVVEETLAFLERELQHPEGAFYSTLDARSADQSGEQVEGAFYVWTPERAAEALDSGAVEDVLAVARSAGADEAAIHALDREAVVDLVCEQYGITEHGNFEGKTVLTRSVDPAKLADDRDLSVETVHAVLDAATETLREVRAERPRPARDEKVLAGWNGLAISAFAEAGLLLDDDAYAESAADALSFLRETLWDGDENRLSRRYRDGDVAIPGYLEDYAFLARGALHTFEATGEVDHLGFAIELAEAIESGFWDSDDRTLFFTPADGESLVARPQELTDQSTPSSSGVAVDVLLALDHFVSHDRFETVATGTLRTHADRIRSDPLQHVSLLLAADRRRRGHLELTLSASDPPRAWLDPVREQFLPDRLLAWRPPAESGLDAWLDGLGLDAAPPIWAERGARDGEPTVYACRDFTCSPPRQDLADALDWAAETLE